MPDPKPRIAITQPYIILGGRLQVILSMVQALNALGIEPDILTLGLGFKENEIEKQYGQKLRMRFRCVMPWLRLPQDYQVLVFNHMLGRLGRNYDLLIDNSNSQIFLPKRPKILSYIHFPREFRVRANVPDISRPDFNYPPFSLPGISRKFLKWIYRYSKPDLERILVCNSKFSADSLNETFPGLQNDVRIIYPPVDLKQYYSASREREHAIVSLGRFSPDKAQLEQIKLAEKMPSVMFKFMGFVFKPDYFEKCQDYIDAHHIQNVHLYPNISFDRMVETLHTARYFLHLKRNEPFGITAVQAIAAGCLPIVHDSGGQREAVFFDALRYHKTEQIPDILTDLETRSQDELDQMASQMQKFAAEHFDESIFQRKMQSLLKNLMGIT